MIDGLGNVSNLLVVGTANPLGLITADRLVGPRLRHLTLLDTDDAALLRAAGSYQNSGVPDVQAIRYTTDDRDGQLAVLTESFGEPDTDVVIMSPPAAVRPDPQWSLGDQAVLDSTVRSSLLDLPVMASRCVELLAKQGHGVLIYFTHVPKPLKSGLNPAYCAAMAGMDIVLSDLAEPAVDRGVDVIAVRLAPEVDPGAIIDPVLRNKAIRASEVGTLVKQAVVRTRHKAPRVQTLTLPRGLRLR